MHPIDLIRIQFEPSSGDLVVFLLGFDPKALGFTACLVDYLESYILAEEGELNMRVIDPVDLFDCEMAGMMGSCKHLYNLLSIK